MSSKAQIRASNKYNKHNTKQLCIRLNKTTDKDIIDALNRKRDANHSTLSICKSALRMYLNCTK